MGILDILNYLAILWLIIVLVGYLVPFAYGLPPTATRPERIRKALKLAELQPGEKLYDLGSGSGRVLIMAAREFGAEAVGIDAGPVQYMQARLSSLFNGVASKVHLRLGNFFKADLREADVVFAYLTSQYARKLEPILASQLKSGARVITISFDFPDWEPTEFNETDLIFLYRMPPKPGDLGTYLAAKS
jgi:SAM-dependent methyltransferase